MKIMLRNRGRVRVAFSALLLAIWACAAGAQETGIAPADQEPYSDSCPDPLTRRWAPRDELKNAGVTACFNYLGEVLGNASGGVRRGTTYEGRLEMLVNLDLEKLVQWSGATIHANAYQIHGRGISANDLGNNLLFASNIEAERSTRLFDLWLEQQLWSSLVAVRIGQLAADDEFITSYYAGVFVNSTFGWPGLTAADLPSGGPAYPLATPGVRVKVNATDQLSVMAAVFNGDPAGRGTGTPQSRDASGTAFRVNDDVFAIAEAAYTLDQGKAAPGLPSIYKLGGWYHSGRFADQRFDGAGQSLANPASSGVPAQRRGDYGLYAIVDQMLWHVPDTKDQGLGVFLRVAGSPSDRNQVDFYVDGGLNYKGLVPGRGGDVLALGAAFARVSDAASSLDRDVNIFNGTHHPVRDHEMAIELTYHAQVTPWWTVQPDLQLILHPAGHVADPTDPTGTRAIRDAVVIGVQTGLSF
jgi:porin